MREIATYLKKYIIGKPLYTDPLVYQLEAGKLEGQYADQMHFGNLRYNENYLQFDLYLIANEKIYEIGPTGEKSLRKDFSGPSSFRYEVARRKSTGEITGCFRFLGCGEEDVPAEAIVSAVYGFQLNGEELSWKEQQMLYRDQPSEHNGYQPVAFDSICRFYLKEGKTQFEYDGICYDVDPVTHQRKQSDSQFPKFISKER